MRLSIRALAGRALVGFGISAALAGCAADAPNRARTEGACYVGGCSNELCSDRPDMVSSCIWHDAYACYQGATCGRQQNGTCDWIATPELTACLASHAH
jgi:hypothetical protein